MYRARSLYLRVLKDFRMIQLYAENNMTDGTLAGGKKIRLRPTTPSKNKAYGIGKNKSAPSKAQ